MAEFTRFYYSLHAATRGVYRASKKSLTQMFLMLTGLFVYQMIDSTKLLCPLFTKLRFLPCDAMHKCGYCQHVVSVHPSVCLSRS